MLGQGKALIHASSLGTDSAGGTRDPTFVAAYQEELDANYRSPWSLGFGAAYGFGKSRLHFSAEYFGKNDTFLIMDGGEFTGQSTGDTLSLSLTDQQNDVFNFGVGFRHVLSSTVTGYTSFRTDFSSVDQGDVDASVSAPLNLYFITAGTALKIPIADITFGLGYGWGSSTVPLPIRNSLEDDRIIGQLPETLRMKYKSLRFIFAFSI